MIFRYIGILALLVVALVFLLPLVRRAGTGVANWWTELEAHPTPPPPPTDTPPPTEEKPK